MHNLATLAKFQMLLRLRIRWWLRLGSLQHSSVSRLLDLWEQSWKKIQWKGGRDGGEFAPTAQRDRWLCF